MTFDCCAVSVARVIEGARVADCSDQNAETMEKVTQPGYRDLAEAGTGLLAPIGSSDRNHW